MHSELATTMAHSETAVLRGRPLLFARAGWAVLAAFCLALFFAAVPAIYARRAAAPEAWAPPGLPENFHAAYMTALMAAFGAGCFAVATVIFWRRSDDFMGLFASLFLVMMGAANHPNVKALAVERPALEPLLELSWGLLCAAFILFVFLFPDGRFAPRWTRVPVGFLVAGVFGSLFFGGGSLSEPPESLAMILIVGLLAGAAAQIHRYARASTPSQRQQTKWVVFGITAYIAVQAASIAAEPMVPRSGLPEPLYDATGVTFVTLAAFLIPLGIGAAILRYRLWDIDIIVNRTLVYGMLTACVVGIYVLVVGYLGALLRTDGNLAISLVATGVVAVLFAPLRERLQRGANRLMYGERDDPYAVISRLAERMEATLEPESILPAVVRTVREALKLPYAAITLHEKDGSFIAAEDGNSVDGTVRMPLSHHGEEIGTLLLAPRPGEDRFSPADRRLLEDLARQAGAAAHAVRLTKDLQRSRERLVTTREEERRRLRRDLHDGLGPTLGSLPMKLDVAGDMISSDPEAAKILLRSLKEQTRSATSDVRRLVHELRPPALDELGLAGAIREVAAQQNGLRVVVEAPETMPPLPAAAEVAAYRIVGEAVTNAARHAGASRCEVRITAGKDGITVGISDDGCGIEANRGSGIGLHSMRERAEELGGSFGVESSPEDGTTVRASLPLAEPEG